MDDEKINILVVDDLDEKLLVYESILEGLGQNLVVARSGREALRHLLDKEFALILLDVQMPEMDGLETAAMIRKRRQTAQTPIIFVTAFTDEMHTAQGYSLGAVDYILTPVVPEILRTKVGVFVDLYRKTQQVKRQAQEHVALARAQAARAAAEAANRRSTFLAEASTVLVRSLDHEAIPRALASHVVPFLGDLCAVVLPDECDGALRAELAWVDPADGATVRTASPQSADLGTLSGPIRRVIAAGGWEIVDLRDPPATAVARPLTAAAPDDCAATTTCASVPDTPVVPAMALIVTFRTRDDMAGAIVLATSANRSPYGPDEIGLVRDLAARAAIALDNARLYRDVQENNRRKNEFLAMLAHELRNPLAPIRSAVEIIRMLDAPDPNLRWANDIITRQVEQLVRLVDDLLDISRVTGGKIQLRMEAVDAAVAVARAVETSQPIIDARHHELSVSLPERTLFVRGDLVRLAQVLSNLLNNAAKYTEEGGRIGLFVTSECDEVAFRVKDNGIGLAPEMIPSIFDLFSQVDRSVDRSQGGLGIGLTLVRQLVEMHGGRIEVFSEGPDRGSEFVVRIPELYRAAEANEPSDQRPAGANGPSGQRPPAIPVERPSGQPRPEVDADGPSGVPPPQVEADEPCDERPPQVEAGAGRGVLIIEECSATAQTLVRTLKLAGHHVRVVHDATAALEELAVADPDIILLDLGVPGMNGHDLARSIRERKGGSAVLLIALAGHSQAEDPRRSFEAGFDHHLTMPVDPVALPSLIASLRQPALRQPVSDAILSPV